jgi:hypothetical protein
MAYSRIAGRKRYVSLKASMERLLPNAIKVDKFVGKVDSPTQWFVERPRRECRLPLTRCLKLVRENMS